MAAPHPPHVVAIMQARMGSTRLPGKVLLDLAGEPMLARDMARAGRARTVAQVVVATTTEPADDAIVALCAARGWASFRGSEADVLDRYYQAARAYQADVVVRITSDCPLLDPGLVDEVVGAFLARQPEIDYACNRRPHHTFPRGLDTEVMRFDALAAAWREDHNPAYREHVTQFILRQPERFRLLSLQNSVDLGAKRWTVDTPEDLAFVRKVYEHFGHDRFTWREVLEVLAIHPEWEDLNRHIQQKEVPG